MLKGIKNCLINNDRRWLFRAVNKNRGDLPLTEILGYGRVGDCIPANDGSKFVGDGRAESPFIARNRQIDLWSILSDVKA
jgi:hypothetical protein